MPPACPVPISGGSALLDPMQRALHDHRDRRRQQGSPGMNTPTCRHQARTGALRCPHHAGVGSQPLPAATCSSMCPTGPSVLISAPALAPTPPSMFLVNAPDKVRALQQCSRVSLLPSPAPGSAMFVSSLRSASPGWNQRGNSSFISSSPKPSSCCTSQSDQKGTPGKHSLWQGRSCTPGAGLQLADSPWVLTDLQQGGTRRASVIANCRCAGPGKTLTG